MKRLISAIALLIPFTVAAQPDLHELVNNKKIDVYNRELTLFTDGARKGIHLSENYGEGVAWLAGVTFSNGSIEFDVRGKDVKQQSFVGIAFHGVNNETFDAIYLRPFQFNAQDKVYRDRGIQYISLPQFTWRKLREQSPGMYEHSIEPAPAPDPNGWVRVRIVVQGTTVSTFIDGYEQPSLVIQKLTNVKAGKVGFYVADVSGGDFANIKITHQD